MIDSAVNVMDDLLQEEFSRASDDGVKSIVGNADGQLGYDFLRDEFADLTQRGMVDPYMAMDAALAEAGSVTERFL